MSYAVNTGEPRECNKCKGRIGISKGFYSLWGRELCIQCHESFVEFVKEKLNEFIQPESSKREDYNIEKFFWCDRSTLDNEGKLDIYVKQDDKWEFMKRDKPENLYYRCGTPNTPTKGSEPNRNE